MKFLGRPDFITHDGNLVVRTKDLPRIYAPVVTKESAPVGKVHDVIGPVSSPYVIIKPKKKGFTTKKDLFVSFQKKRRRKAGGKYRASGKKG